MTNTPEEKIVQNDQIYLLAQGPTVHDMLSALDLSTDMLNHLEEHYFDDPRFMQDEAFHRIFAEYHEALRSLALMLNHHAGGHSATGSSE